MLTIRETVIEDPAVTEVKWTTGRNAGRFRFVEIGVALRVAELDKAEAVVRRIESAVRAAVPHVERVLLHVEAPTAPYVRYAVPLADRVGRISDHFGEAPWLALVEVGRIDGRIAESRILANPHCNEERAKGMRVAEWLVAQKVDVVLTREELKGRGPAYVLRDAGIELRVSDCRALADVLDEQIRQKMGR